MNKISRCFFAITILALFALPIPAFANAAAPFMGHWQAVDVDGSDIDLMIAGPPQGPYKIIWTENYFGFCNREPGIVEGIGLLRESDPLVLEADLRLRCFTTGASIDFHVTWQYDPETDTIAYLEPDPVILTWHRPGKPLPWEWRSIIAHPDQEWVEGWGYDEGSVVSLRIFDPEGNLLFGNVAVASYPEWSPDVAWVEYQVGYDLKAGDHLFMTDGRIAKNLVVSGLQITGVDPATMTVSGTAARRSQVIFEYPPDLYSTVRADKQGNWSASIEGMPLGSTGLASQEDEDGDLTRLEIYVPETRFTVWPEGEFIEGYDWRPGDAIHLEIDDPRTPDSPDYSQDETAEQTPWNPRIADVRFDLNGLYDVKPGDLVIMSDGVTTRTHTVRNLGIFAIDYKEDTISGTADEGEIVYVWPHATGQTLEDVADSEGIWQVDFTGIYDLAQGDGGRAEIRDEVSNATTVEWSIPNPHFVVFPEWEWFDGANWPDGATVSINVQDKPECSLERESWDYFFNGSFPDGCDIVVGDTVTFSDGDTTRTHTVRNLAVTALDIQEDTASGTADEGAVVFVWPHDGWFEPLQGIANDSGDWQVDLGDAGYDLQPGSAGRSEIRDEEGNGTAVDWSIPNPHFVVFPEWEWFDGLDWPDGATVSISVGDKPECSTEKESWGYFFNGGFPDGCDLEIGDNVTFSDRVTTRTHTVRNLTVRGVDEEEDTVSGTADVGEVVYVWPHATGEQMQATADASGNWQVDFTGIFDLVTGEGGRAQILDEEGNATAVDWETPNPLLFE